MKTKNLKNTLLSLALLSSMLGAGNIMLGNSRIKEFAQILSEANSKLSRVEKSWPLPPSVFEDNASKDAQYFVKVRGQMSFYELVVLGGKAFLALAASLALAYLLIRDESRQ